MCIKSWRLLSILLLTLAAACVYKPPPLPPTYKPAFDGEVTRITKPIKISYKPTSGVIRKYSFFAKDNVLETEKDYRFLYDIKKQERMLAAKYELISGKKNGRVLDVDTMTGTVDVDIFNRKGVLMTINTISKKSRYTSGDVYKATDFPTIPLIKTKIKTGDIITNSDFMYDRFEYLFKRMGLVVNKNQLNGLLPKVQGLCQYKGQPGILLSVDSRRLFTSKLQEFDGKRVAVIISATGYFIIHRDTLERLKSENVIALNIRASVFSVDRLNYILHEKE